MCPPVAARSAVLAFDRPDAMRNGLVLHEQFWKALQVRRSSWKCGEVNCMAFGIFEATNISASATLAPLGKSDTVNNRIAGAGK